MYWLRLRCALQVVAYMFADISSGLLEEVDKVGRSQFSEERERVGSGINRLLEDLLCDPKIVGGNEVSTAPINTNNGRHLSQLKEQEGH